MRPAPINAAVRMSQMIDELSRRAPSIVVFTLCATLVGAWLDVPVWLPTALAVVIGALALVLFAARVRRHQPPADADEPQSWIGYELAGKGTPPGYYVLAFFGFITIMLTGFQGPYALPAWAAFALGAVWGLANRSYTGGEELES